jgi:hypothetical protein
VGEFWHAVLIDEPEPLFRRSASGLFLSKKNTMDIFRAFHQDNNHYQRGITPVLFWKESFNLIPTLKLAEEGRPRIQGHPERGFFTRPYDLVKSFCDRNRVKFPDDYDDLDFIPNKEDLDT